MLQKSTYIRFIKDEMESQILHFKHNFLINSTPGWRIFLQQLIVTQLHKKVPAFIEPKIHPCVHKSSPLGTTQSQLNPVLTATPHTWYGYKVPWMALLHNL